MRVHLRCSCEPAALSVVVYGAFLCGMVGLGVFSRPALAAERVLFTHALCIEPAAAARAERSLLVQDGRIVALGRPDGTDLEGPEIARRVDLSGRFLLPALVDFRVRAGVQRSPGHLDRVGGAGSARLLFSAGVLDHVDLTDPVESALLAARLERTASAASRPHLGGPVLVGPGGPGAEWPGALPLPTAVRARVVADSLLRAGPPGRLLTVVFDHARGPRGLDVERLAAILEVAEQSGASVVVDVGTWADVETALEHGARWFAHVPDAPLPEALGARLAALPIEWTPTLALAHDFLALVREDSLRREASLARVLPESLRVDYGQVRIPQSRQSEALERNAIRAANVARLDGLGVRWRPGSEAGALGTAFGWSLLRELHWLHAAGIPIHRVLAAATTEAAEKLGRRTGFQPGARADWLILAEDPLADLRALTTLQGVVLDGRIHDPLAVARSVGHRLEEHMPRDPIPFGAGRAGLFVMVVGALGALLLARAAVKRAAQRAREDD